VEELVQRGAKVLVPCGTSASMAAKRGGGSLPILFISVGNPVGIGLVSSLARPGGTATGYSDDLADLAGKYVQFARELGKPNAPIHYLWHSGWADGQYRLRATENAAQSAGMKLRPVGVTDVAEMTAALAAMKKAGATAVIIQPSPFTYRQRDRIIALATQLGLATIFAFPPAAREGALLAYGPDYADLYRRAGVALERVLKGARPADIPVQLPSKFDLVLNLKTARTLGLEIPRALRAQATEIVE
jgi:putative ABC transport system substrate-binding protein